MYLQLSLMTKEDVPAFVEVDDEAMQNYGMAKAMATSLPPGMTRKQLIASMMEQSFKQDEKTVWLKVIDQENGQFAAAALWLFENARVVSVDDEDVREADAAPKLTTAEEDLPKSFHELTSQRSKAFKDKYLNGAPHATLAILFTGPKFRRRGAANMLVKWGCDQADQRGMKSALFASPEGLSVYLKHGFQVVEEDIFDLRPYDVDETVVRRSMIREPRT